MLSSIAVALALTAQTPAAQPPAGPEAEIIVRGSRADQERQLSDFVDALTPSRIGGQLSRFDWAACPAAAGLSAAQNQAIAERMRQVAVAAGVPVGSPGCRPTVLLLVTRDKAALINGLKAKHPAYFTGVPRDQVKQLARSPGPAAAWHVEGLLDADGVAPTRDKLTGQYTVERTDSPSRLRTSARPHFLASVVVVEVEALAGLTTTQLADYAAMRAFARTEPNKLKASRAPTILTVLDTPMGGSVPVTLTQWDLAFLKALYGSSTNRLATQQRKEMKQIVEDEVQGNKPR